MNDFQDCSHAVIGACIEVHRTLGPGLLESAYETCLAQELTFRGLSFERQKILPVKYRGVTLDQGYRLDFIVHSELIVEVKAVDTLLPVHRAQLITYLQLTEVPTGLLVNFHVATLREGLRRLTLQSLNRPARAGRSISRPTPASAAAHLRRVTNKTLCFLWPSALQNFL